MAEKQNSQYLKH